MQNYIGDAVNEGLGSLGFSQYSDWLGRSSCTVGGGQGSMICAIPDHAPDMAYVSAKRCGRTGDICTTSSGNPGRVYCCPPPELAERMSSESAPVVSGDRACLGAEHSGGTTYWRNVQRILCQRGFDPGVIDGKVGPNTRGAVRQFQAARGITQSGNIDASTASQLGVTQETAAARITTTTAPSTSAAISSTQVTSAATRFFDVRNPLMWVGVVGVAAGAFGVVHWLRKRKK